MKMGQFKSAWAVHFPHSGELTRPVVQTKKCPLMQSGSSLRTADNAFGKGIRQKHGKPNSKLTFHKFEISKTFLINKMSNSSV
jgi:hypothetical protein